MLAVRGRSAGDVPDREPETLLHSHEETWQEEATEGDKTAHESGVGHVL